MKTFQIEVLLHRKEWKITLFTTGGNQLAKSPISLEQSGPQPSDSVKTLYLLYTKFNTINGQKVVTILPDGWNTDSTGEKMLSYMTKFAQNLSFSAGNIGLVKRKQNKTNATKQNHSPLHPPEHTIIIFL